MFVVPVHPRRYGRRQRFATRLWVSRSPNACLGHVVEAGRTAVSGGGVATQPCLILPGLGNSSSDYNDMLGLLPAHSRVLPIARYDWLRNARGLLLPAYWRGALQPQQVMEWYFLRLELVFTELIRALGEEGDWGVTLIGHSAGGWLARLFVSEFASPVLRKRVRAVITLGTPNVAPPPGVFDQTRGILAYLETRYHWQHRKNSGIRYVCVGSKAVRGRPWSRNLDELVAYASYWPICGRGHVVGDGIVPACASFMRGAQAILLADAKHSPLTDAANWYGSPHQFARWAHALA